MSMSPREKELVAIGISFAVGCKPCLDHHVNIARKEHATDHEIRRAVADAFFVRRNAAYIMEAHALAHLGETRDKVRYPASQSRMNALVCVGAAFAVNCISSYEHFIAEADSTEISQDDILEIVRLAGLIRKRATSHIERRAGLQGDKVS